MSSRRLPALLVASLFLAACSDGGSSGSTATTDTSPVPSTTVAGGDTSFTVMPGTEQIAVLDAQPGAEVQAIAPDGSTAATLTADEQGSALFRELAPGDGWHVTAGGETTGALTVASPTDLPPQSLYTDGQTLLPAGGFGYITVRDGTTLSANVILPGKAEDGPYPTVVEYSGYQPSDPDSAITAALYTSQGFAYVGVNVRGTGCSGGSYRFFETVQNLDGYDVIEAVAAQSWVKDHEVGMVGISYPGISQLFVAATQPPSLNSITPLSVIDDSYRGTLYPGGMLNTGFALQWVDRVTSKAVPYGQEWTKARADDGDTVCADNQQLRLQNPDLVGMINDHPYYSADLGDPISPSTFVDKITVPVFLAGAWQDEQTGGHFPVMIPKFTGSPHVYVTLANGLHTEALSPPFDQRYFEFLQLYVGKKVPDLSFAAVLAPILGNAIWGVGTFAPLTNRFEGDSYEQALAAFEGEKPVRILFEQGGNDDYAAGTPEPNFVAEFSAWPIPEAEARVWNLDGCGCLQPEGTTLSVPGEASYIADPTALPETFYTGDSSGIWRADTQYDWRPLPDGKGVGYVTPALTQDTVIAGTGSVDLWIKSSAKDTDLEVTISEVRPDGKEIYVQSGWLRASQRALDGAASTELRPVQTHTEADAADLPAGEFTPVRIELFPFAHPFRAGSRIRLTIHAPGNNRPVWVFRTISSGETVTIAMDAQHPSRLVLPVVPVTVGNSAPPACGALRGQPCRSYVPASNGG